jgi:hypothetical protein
LIDSVTHAFEVFKTLDIVLKDTPTMEKSDSRPVHLVELVNTTCEQLVDDLIASVKHVVIGD